MTHVHFPIVSRPILILQEEREVDKSKKKEKWDELANKKMMGKTEMTRKTGATRVTKTSHTTGKRTIYSICVMLFEVSFGHTSLFLVALAR